MFKECTVNFNLYIYIYIYIYVFVHIWIYIEIDKLVVSQSTTFQHSHFSKHHHHHELCKGTYSMRPTMHTSQNNICVPSILSAEAGCYIFTSYALLRVLTDICYVVTDMIRYWGL